MSLKVREFVLERETCPAFSICARVTAILLRQGIPENLFQLRQVNRKMGWPRYLMIKA